ncbi:MAG: putative quinol monooxygenase [Planctomycetota bacterium]
MADEKITVLAKIKAKDQMAETVKQQALALVAPTRSEAGCISYDFHQSTDDETLFMFYENWTSKKALDEHLRMPYLQAFIAKADELLAGPLDVTIWKKLT